MKKISIVYIFVLITVASFSQVFPEPTGMAATDPNIAKKINKCDATALSGIQAPKSGAIARRFSYGIGIWNELYQLYGKKWGPCLPSFSCIDCKNCEDNELGWNKIGRITFIRKNNVNRHKLHVGWRADPNNDHQLKMSAYFHESTDEKKTNHFVSHYITNVHTDTEPYIDMYLSIGTIAMIVKRSAVVMRKPGMIPSTKNTYLKRAFYFGDTFWSNESCLTPEDMKIEFRTQHYDWSGFPEELNQCKYITVNISEFESGDEHTFYAYEEMYGSISDAKATTDVQYDTNHPDPVKQKCIISSGAEIIFSAGEKIILSHGFHAKPGSNFKAIIVNKEKYAGYYDEPKRLNLPPLDQSEPCSKLPDSIYFASEVNNLEENGYGISSNNQESFSIYPNPSPGLFTLQFDNGENTGFEVEITNMMGNVVYRKESVRTGNIIIDIKEKPKGIYFVKVVADGKVYLKKVIVDQ